MNAMTTKIGYLKPRDQWGICCRIMGLKGMICVILAFVLGAVAVKCAPMGIQTKGESGPIAWEATDLRIVQRTVDGFSRELYAFTLVLKELQGEGITFIRIKTVLGSISAGVGSVSEHKGRWELPPNGELRLPLSSYISGDVGPFARTIAPVWDIILTGKDENSQPVRIAIHLALPGTPPPRVNEAKTKPPSAKRASLSQPTIVPIIVARNLIFVSATLAGKERATLLVDTGASKSVLSPDMARLLEISPTEDSPRKTFNLLGGRKATIPVVELSSIQVGEALVNNLQVGVSIVHPNAPLVDGILGGDFLGHFKVTVDRAGSRLKLEPLDAL